ncbi:MAG: hypothetical protein WED09_07370 [Homoserinimonas sp.]
MSGLERPEEVVDWSAVEVLAEVTAERDRARATAVRLEQELAEVERQHMVFVEAGADTFRGACSCGWRGTRNSWRQISTFARGHAAEDAAEHGLAVW